MEKNFFWVADQVARNNFNVTWQPGKENLADYFTKHFDAKHHQTVRPYYLHSQNSLTHLPRALLPSTLKGCVGPLPNDYARSAPLPQLWPDCAQKPMVNLRDIHQSARKALPPQLINVAIN